MPANAAGTTKLVEFPIHPVITKESYLGAILHSWVSTCSTYSITLVEYEDGTKIPGFALARVIPPTEDINVKGYAYLGTFKELVHARIAAVRHASQQDFDELTI